MNVWWDRLLDWLWIGKLAEPRKQLVGLLVYLASQVGKVGKEGKLVRMIIVKEAGLP